MDEVPDGTVVLDDDSSIDDDVAPDPRAGLNHGPRADEAAVPDLHRADNHRERADDGTPRARSGAFDDIAPAHIVADGDMGGFGMGNQALVAAQNGGLVDPKTNRQGRVQQAEGVSVNRSRENDTRVRAASDEEHRRSVGRQCFGCGRQSIHKASGLQNGVEHGLRRIDPNMRHTTPRVRTVIDGS